MKQYRLRIADRILTKKLSAKGAVLIEGAKWCGKTTTALQVAKSILKMQDPAERQQNIAISEINPSMLLNGETPRLIDEWQIAPKLWDAIRYEIDERDKFGQFILTGSATPPDTSEIFHSGTGRITRMLMRPMSLFESGDSTGEISLKNLFEQNFEFNCKNNIDIKRLAFLICRGGWPKSVGQDENIALQQAIDYFDAVVNIDVSRVDNIKRNPEKTRKILRAYARSIGTQAKLSTLLEDINQTENIAKIASNPTLADYIEALKKIFVLEDSKAWNTNLRSKTAIRTSDTRYYTDPSIAAAALEAGPNDLLNDLNTMGFFFENLCIRDLRIYAEILDGNVYHYRDKSGLECDAVVHIRGGKYGLVEIKIGGDKLINEGIETLNKLSLNIDTSKTTPPSFKMVLTGIGKFAYKKDDVLIVPVGCLRD